MRAAIYARSAVAGGCDKQLWELRPYVVQRSWELVGEYVDDGSSGLDARRPGLDRLLTDAALAKFDCVLIRDAARLSRNTVELLRQLKHFAESGVQIIAADQSADGRAQDDQLSLFQLLAAFGKK